MFKFVVTASADTSRSGFQRCATRFDMIRPKTYVERAANGHLMISWPDAGSLFYLLLCWRLRLRYGLRRAGREVLYPTDDIILPTFVGDGLQLFCGWDNRSGYYLLSEDAAGDHFLSQFAAPSH